MALVQIPGVPAHFTDEADLSRLGRGVVPIGAWSNPSGWKGAWMWTGRMVLSPGIAEVATLGPKGKAIMQPAPAHIRRDREVPQIVFVRDLAQVKKRVKRGWSDARKLPREQQAMIVDAYGPELNSLQREFCSEELAARETAARILPRPAQDAQPGAATKGRAGGTSAAKKKTTKQPKKEGPGGGKRKPC